MPNGRCRMHGGTCKGPASPEGRARMTAANTSHGRFAAEARTGRRYIRTLITRTRLLCTARNLWPYLPPDMSDRLAAGPEELATPVHPTNIPYLTTQQLALYRLTTLLAPAPETRRTPAPTARAAEHQAAQAEAATQAPWRQAIALARTAKRAHRAAKRAAQAARAAARLATGKNHPSRRNAIHRETTAQPPGSPGNRQTHPAQRNAMHRENAASAAEPPPDAPGPAPHPTACDLCDLERELAARRAGLRGPNHGQPHPEPGPAPKAAFAPAERNAIHREQPPAAPANAQTKPPQRNPVHREPPTAPRRTCPSATQAAFLRTTTLAEAGAPALPPLLAQCLSHAIPTSGWRIPQALLATDPVANAVRAILAGPQLRPTPTTGHQPRC